LKPSVRPLVSLVST